MQVAAGSYHTVVIKKTGALVAWGYEAWTHNLPPGLTGVTQITVGPHHNLALVPYIDCDGNTQRDGYEIGRGWVPDSNANGRQDACEVALGDIDLSGNVDFGDVALIMLDFGPCAGCHSDLDGNGVVDFGDVAMALLNFGPTG
jgi:hypothetical protein